MKWYYRVDYNQAISAVNSGVRGKKVWRKPRNSSAYSRVQTIQRAAPLSPLLFALSRFLHQLKGSLKERKVTGFLLGKYGEVLHHSWISWALKGITIFCVYLSTEIFHFAFLISATPPPLYDHHHHHLQVKMSFWMKTFVSRQLFLTIPQVNVNTGSVSNLISFLTNWPKN